MASAGSVYSLRSRKAIAEEHPEMKRGDVFELVQEWLRLEDDLTH